MAATSAMCNSWNENLWENNFTIIALINIQGTFRKGCFKLNN